MPKLTEKQLEEVRYVSLSDFSNQVERFENPIDKRKFAVRYLLTYGLSGDPDFPLHEAIHFVRVKLAESIDENTADLNTKVFLANPVKYLNVCANNEYSKFDANPKLIADAIVSEHYYNLREALNSNLGNQVASLDRDKNTFDVKARMAISMGGQAQLANCVKNTKSGFFSRLFNTSSDEAKNLDRVYKGFNDPTSEDYGDLTSLEQAGLAYLRYKFPGVNLNKSLPTVDAISRLDKTAKARALLSLRAIEAAREQRRVTAFEGMGKLNTVNDVDVKELLSEDSIIDKEKFMENLAQEDKANKLEELKDGEEMNLDDEQLVEPISDDSEQYALDESEHPSIIDTFNNSFEREIVNNIDEIGESFYEKENIEKRQKEDEELRKHFADGKFRNELTDEDFQKEVKEDSEIFINTQDIEEQMKRHEYHPRREDRYEPRYEPSILKQIKKENNLDDVDNANENDESDVIYEGL